MTSGFQRSTVIGFLSLARVALVTSLRDGMNLVAKEYIAAQPADDPGMLVLSAPADTAMELVDAIIVNPCDIGGVATGLAQVLAMSREERQARWLRMMAVLCAVDIYHYHWVADYLDALRAVWPP
ncbi:MAG: trehalose-6-phosphate synthase [Gammaproteobacteria bacterium]|nr:trehalose-6-phosphate synthase [Gammaproteobacteria bacterium]MDE2344909.1 trehalose-6-phosphate synthase [Gammaproteobacteria bacterium]